MSIAERLRAWALVRNDVPGLGGSALLREAADHIEELDAEATRLREALERVFKTGRGTHVEIARDALNA